MDDFAYAFDADRHPEEFVLMGKGKNILRIPADHWKKHVAEATVRISARLAFMSEEHHLVRRFAVTEIAHRVKPLTETRISRQLGLPVDRVHQILAELESRLFFLARNAHGAVSWAYPFTSDQTPHRIVRRARGAARAA